MLENLLQWMGMGLCHQLPERSFTGGGVQVPVCARDTGIYAGFAVALVLLGLMERKRRSAEVPPMSITLALIAGIALMALDGLTSYLGIRETNNALRLTTGLAAGFAIGAFTIPLLNAQLWRRSGQTRVLGRARDVALFLAAIPVTGAIVMWVMPSLGVAYPVLVAVAILVTFTSVNLVIVCLIPLFDRRFDRLRDTGIAVGFAFALTIVELGLSSLLRVFLVGVAA